MSIFETYSFSGESVNCYGLHLVSESLKFHGHEVREFEPLSQNPILFSLYWPEQVYDFVKFCKTHSLEGRIKIVGGNYPSTSPNSIFPFCDYIFLGDGEEWDGNLNSENIISKNKPHGKRKIVDKINPKKYEDIQSTRRSFVEISRGCKNKCKFCQYGWLKPYRESDINDICAVIEQCKTKTIRAFAADRFQHTQYPKIRAKLDKLGKCDSGSDVSIRFLLKNPEYLKLTNKVRVGVEGLSYRLRRHVGKNYTDEEIVNFCKMVSDAGIKCLDWYMIYGLPTETREDSIEFNRLIRKLDEALPVGYCIAIHWNAFTPSAITPFQSEAAAPFESRKYMQEMFSEIPNKRIKIMHKPKLTSYETLVRRMIAIRSTNKSAKLIEAIADSPSVIKNKMESIIKYWEKQENASLMGKWPNNVPMPWEHFND